MSSLRRLHTDPSPQPSPRRGEDDDRSLMPRFWKTLPLFSVLARRRAKLLLSRGWSPNSPGGSPFQLLVGPAIGSAKLLLSQRCDGVGVMTVGRVLPSTSRNMLSAQSFCRESHLRGFVPIIRSTTLKSILYKYIYKTHNFGGIDDGLCRLFSYPNITHCTVTCSDDSGVMPIIRSSRASAWHNTLCKVHVVPIMQSSSGTSSGAERCARPTFSRVAFHLVRCDMRPPPAPARGHEFPMNGICALWRACRWHRRKRSAFGPSRRGA